MLFDFFFVGLGHGLVLAALAHGIGWASSQAKLPLRER
jgi:hypothetical protein